MVVVDVLLCCYLNLYMFILEVSLDEYVFYFDLFDEFMCNIKLFLGECLDDLFLERYFEVNDIDIYFVLEYDVYREIDFDICYFKVLIKL